MYSIYALSDPRDKTIRYIGMSKNVKQQFLQHVRTLEGNSIKVKWILDLKRFGLKPILSIVEELQEIEQTKVRELYWIRYYYGIGMPLTNSQCIGVIRIPIPEGIHGQYYTIDHIARFFQVTHTMMLKLIYTGKISAFHIGREYHIVETEVIDYIRRERVIPEREAS